MVGFQREQTEHRRTKSEPNGYNFGAPYDFDSRTSAHHPSRDAAVARFQFARCEPCEQSNDESCARGRSTSNGAGRRRRVRTEHSGESVEQPCPNTQRCSPRSRNEGAYFHRC